MKYKAHIIATLVWTCSLLFSSFTMFCGKIEMGFEALAVYDYFLAKKIFSKLNLKKKDPYASYGLAQIYMRTDNPFSNLDSAVKYVHLSYNTFLKTRQPLTASGFTVDSLHILKLADTIAFKYHSFAKQQNTVAACDRFLRNMYLGKKRYLYEIVYLRDELEFNNVMQVYQSDTTLHFITTHPQSIFLKEAGILMDRQLYDEETRPGRPATYITFIERHPKNVMVNTAYEKLFNFYRKENDAKGLSDFVNNYPKAPQNLEAWKLLFSLTVKTYSYGELKKFIDDYPKFPLKKTILKELELNKLVLYPCGFGDYWGFVDNKGKLAIRPIYDEASGFSEGLSVVSKNDSVFYVNKENQNPFQKIYEAAGVFRNGIAPVKQNNKWFFINRQGQQFSGIYDELNEISNNIYIVKLGDKYGALDQYGQSLLEPQFEKLGDFKNDLAYYLDGGLYGFVSRSGSIHKAEFEWISDFNEDLLAVFRQQNKYGLVNSKGKKLLEPLYDQVIEANNRVFIVVSNNLYGFYSADGCFISPLQFDYQKEKPASFYTDGKLFKLQKKNEQAMMDANGRMLLTFGVFEDIGFPKNGLVRIKQKNKYGYTDSRYSVVVPVKYQEAGDFDDSLAIVRLREKSQIINTAGKDLYSTESPIKKISSHFYLVEDDTGTLVDRAGTLIVSGVEDYKILDDVLLLTLNNGEIRLLNE